MRTGSLGRSEKLRCPIPVLANMAYVVACDSITLTWRGEHSCQRQLVLFVILLSS